MRLDSMPKMEIRIGVSSIHHFMRSVWIFLHPQMPDFKIVVSRPHIYSAF